MPYPLVYLTQYLAGLGITLIGVELFGLNQKLVPALVIAVTVPTSFLLTRWILVRRSRRDEEPSPLAPPN